MRGTSFLPYLVFADCASVGLFFGLPLCLLCDGSNHRGFLLNFLDWEATLFMNVFKKRDILCLFLKNWSEIMPTYKCKILRT